MGLGNISSVDERRRTQNSADVLPTMLFDVCSLISATEQFNSTNIMMGWQYRYGKRWISLRQTHTQWVADNLYIA